MRRGLALVSVVWLTGCVTLPRVAVPPPPPLTTSTPSPEVDALVADFYGDTMALPAVTARAREVLARHPGDARAHEVAAYAALLAGDASESARHFLAAAADLGADATLLYLLELSVDLPVSELDSARRLLGELRVRHPDAQVRALATARLALVESLGHHLDQATALGGELGYLRDWALLGALDNDQGKGFLTAYPPESGVDLGAVIAGPLVPLGWRTVEQVTARGTVVLSHLLWPREYGLAYLATWIKSDSARTAQLRLSSSDAVRAWCNDGLVLSEELIANGELDNLIAPVTLHAGWNQLLIKTANRRGDWWLRARLTDEHGAPLPGLTATATRQRYQPGPARDEPSTLPPPAPTGGPENRRRFILARLQDHYGRKRPALTTLQSLLGAAPRNPLAVYFGALAYWDNEELGKAIDLLNQGVAATGNTAASFLVKRARYYRQKQLFEKAQSDLQAAVALGPDLRPAQMDLAGLYAQRGWQVDRCRVLDGILGRWPDYAPASRELGACRDALGYPADAERLLARAVALLPGDLAAWEQRLTLAWRKLDFAAVGRALGEQRRLEPTNPEPLVQQGELARRTGDPVTARARFLAAAHLAPEWPRPRERLANLDYEAGHRDAALAEWKDAQARDPNNATLAQRIEFLQPTQLGALEKWVPGDVEIDRALALRPRPNQASQSALLLDDEVTEANADGSARRVVTEVALALNEQGRDDLTHHKLPSTGQLKILRAYALGEHGGERQEASSIRGGEVRFRNLQVGSRVVLQYVHYQPAPHFLPGSFVATRYFQTLHEQHEAARWVLLLPSERKLHVQTTGAVQSEASPADGRTAHVFSAAHVPPLAIEAHMPPAPDLLAQVSVSTVDSWDDYVRWERALLSDAFRSNPKLDELTDQLVAGATTPRERFDKLLHHVTQEVRYQQDYETTIAGVRPHAASAVLERGYGDCKDKAVLLIQMGRRAGLQLRFAILRTTNAGRMRRDVPNQQFNHAIVYVPVQPGIESAFFVDPTADGLDMGNLPAGDQGATSLVMDPDSGRWELLDIPFQAPSLQLTRHQVRIDVKSPTEASASDEITLRGGTAMAMRHVLRNQGQAKKMYETMSSMLFPGTTLRSAHSDGKEDTWKPVTLELDVDVSGALQPEDDKWRLVLPVRFPLQDTMTLKARETPLELGAPDASRADVVVQLPAGLQIAHAPRDFTVEHGCFTARRQAQTAPHKLTVHVEYERRCSEVSTADYAAFRDAVQRTVQAFQDGIVLSR